MNHKRPGRLRRIRDEDVKFYREHPELLEQHFQVTRRSTRDLGYAFLIGFAVNILSRFIAYYPMDLPEWLIDFLSEFLYDLGVSIWGAVVAIFLLEAICERNQRIASEWYNQIKLRLDAEK